MKLTAVLVAIVALAIAPRGLKPALYGGRDATSRGLKPALYDSNGERRAEASASASPASAPPAAPAATASIGVPDRINQHVSIAATGEFVAVVWAASKTGSGTDIYAAISRDEGHSFSGPVRVNGSTSADVGGEQPPQVAVTRAGGVPTVIVVWTSKGDAGTRLMAARSTDAGKTFSVASVVPGSDAPGNRGWESIAVDARGRVVALWLDHREMARGGGEGAHHHGAEGSASASSATSDGAARAQASQLYFGSLGENAGARGIARGVCYCCKTALVSDSGGTVSAAWRHVYPGNVRDMAFAASRDGGRTFSAPVRVSEDGWQIDGCPENGPALTIDRDQRTHIVWPTVVRDKAQSTLALFHASTKDGRTFTARSPLPVSGPAYHPRLVTMADGSLLAAWDEVVNGARRIRLARGRPDAGGRVAFTSIDRAQPIQAQYPALVATSSGAALAWSSGAIVGSRISVERIGP